MSLDLKNSEMSDAIQCRRLPAKHCHVTSLIPDMRPCDAQNSYQAHTASRPYANLPISIFFRMT
jgi:hypothetical protein